MGKSLLINARDEEESRVAVVEDGILEDIYTESASREQIKGNIYKGQIVKVEASFQAAFVDYGGIRDGFLPIGDVHPRYYVRQGSASGPGGQPRIQDVLRRKQEVLVQVVKEAVGSKGAALTTHISLPGRYLVLMPYTSGATRVSRKIEEEEERKKLKELLSQLEPPKNMGFIVRTAGLSRTKSEITSDLNYLVKLWATIESSVKVQKTPALIYKERDLIIRTIRDYFMPDIEQVLIDNKEVYRQAREFVKMVMPRYLRRIKQYTEQQPIFSHAKIEDQIEAIYLKKVLLKSGGSIVIEPTEALVSVDVNSGRATRGTGIEETALATNLEAAVEVARQLRLRDLGGLVVVDFIDMYEANNRGEVERTLRAELKKDKAKVQVSRISKFGLCELSRQRMRAAIQESSYVPCQHCQGSGLVKSREVAALALLRQLQDAVSTGDYKLIRGHLSLETAAYLLNQKRSDLSRIEHEHNMTIILEGSPNLQDSEQRLELVKRPPVKKKSEHATDDDTVLAEEQLEIAAARAEAVAGEERDDEDGAQRRRRRSRGGRRRSRRRRGKAEAVGEEETNGGGKAEAAAAEAIAPEVSDTTDDAARVKDEPADDKLAESTETLDPAETPAAKPPRRSGGQTRGRRRERQPAKAKSAASESPAEEASVAQPAAETDIEEKAPAASSLAATSQLSGNGSPAQPETAETLKRDIRRPRRQPDEPFVIEAVSEPLLGEQVPAAASAVSISISSKPEEPTSVPMREREEENAEAATKAAATKTTRRRTSRSKTTAEKSAEPTATSRQRKSTAAKKSATKSAGTKTKRTSTKTRAAKSAASTTTRRTSAARAKKGASATPEATAPSDTDTNAEPAQPAATDALPPASTP